MCIPQFVMTRHNDAGPRSQHDEIPFDDALARHLVATQFPGLGPIRVTACYGGMDHHAVEINSSWIVRFSKRAECEPMLLRELTLLPAIAPRLSVPVPRYELVGTATPAYPCVFAGYRKLAGVPAIALPTTSVDSVTLARCLGGILSALHAEDAERSARLGVVRLEDFEDAAALRTSTLDELPEIRSAVPAEVFAWCQEQVERLDRVWNTAPGTVRLLHGDLSAEHILIDPATGRVTGLIDWADACLGDPAYDFKFLWVWLGTTFVGRVLDHYAPPRDATFLDRVRVYGVCTAVGEVAYGRATGRADNLRLGVEALRRAFAEQA